MAVQADERPVADRGQAAGDARGGQPGHQHQEHGEAGEALRHEDPSRRADRHEEVAPGAQPVLGREDVAGDQRRQQRERPAAREVQHDQGPRPAGRVHPAAEDRVGGQRALQAHRGHEDRGGDPAGEQQYADPPLGEQLDQLEPVATQHRRRPRLDREAARRSSLIRTSSSSVCPVPVRARNAASSGGTTGASSRTATPARTSRTTSSSRAGTGPRTTRTSAVRPLDAVANGRDVEPRHVQRHLAGGRRVGGEQPVVELAALGGELAHRPGEDDPPGGEEGDLGAQRGEVVHPVAGEDHRGPVLGEPGDDAVHVALAGGVQAVGRLVEDEQSRCGEQRGGQPEPLAHTQRESPEAVVGDVGEPDLLQRVVDARGATGVVPAQ